MKKLLYFVYLFVGIFLLINLSKEYFFIIKELLISLILAIIIGVNIKELYNYLKKYFNKWVLRCLFIAFFGSFLFLLISKFIPYLYYESIKILPKCIVYLKEIKEELFNKFGINIDNNIFEFVEIKAVKGVIFDTSLNVLEAIFSYLKYVLLIPVFSFYFALYYDDFKIFLNKNIQNIDVLNKLKKSKIAIINYGKCFVYTFLSMFTLCLVLYLILGFENVVVIALIIGLFDIIPYIGPIMGGFCTSLIVLGSNPELFYINLGILFVVQIIEEFLITPKILSKKFVINPLFMIIILMIFSHLFGIFGLVLGPLVISLFKIWKNGLKIGFF